MLGTIKDLGSSIAFRLEVVRLVVTRSIAREDVPQLIRRERR